jgi:hypothetical protein
MPLATTVAMAGTTTTFRSDPVAAATRERDASPTGLTFRQRKVLDKIIANKNQYWRRDWDPDPKVVGWDAVAGGPVVVFVATRQSKSPGKIGQLLRRTRRACILPTGSLRIDSETWEDD